MRKFQMKKIISIIAALCVITIADAQNYDDTTIKSVRGGLTLSQQTISGLHTQMGCGFNLEFNLQKQLSDTYPIYLETGIGLNLKKIGQMLLFSDPDESFYEPRYTFLGIPLMVNYKFFTDDDIVIYPSIGVALQIGLVENYDDTWMGTKSVFDGDEPFWDLPLRFGITAEFQQKYIINYTHEASSYYLNTYSFKGFFVSNYITLGIRF